LEYRKLGHTPYVVSRICFGSLTIGPLAGNLSLLEGAAVIREALERGVNFIDTAQYYDNYPYICEALRGWDKEVIIASKSYATTYDEMALAVEEARIALGRDKIDIFLLHEQRSAQAVLDHMPALEYLHDAKAVGVVGACGISTHNVSAARIAAELPEIEVLHAMMNKEGIGINGGSRNEMIAAMCAAHKAGKGIYGMKALGGGSLMQKAKEMLDWAFAQDFMDSIAIGMKDLSEVATNIGWFLGQEPPEAKNIKKVDHVLCIDESINCANCGHCVQTCEQGALSHIDGRPIWDKAKCLYCGYCIPACPNFYISIC